MVSVDGGVVQKEICLVLDFALVADARRLFCQGIYGKGKWTCVGRAPVSKKRVDVWWERDFWSGVADLDAVDAILDAFVELKE